MVKTFYRKIHKYLILSSYSWVKRKIIHDMLSHIDIHRDSKDVFCQMMNSVDEHSLQCGLQQL